jgi:hypothetical protein
MIFTRSRPARFITAAAAIAVSLGLAFAASATAVTAPTEITFSITGGGLALSAPATSSASGALGSLGTVPQLTAPVTGNQVTDNRGSLLGWSVMATATDLAGQGSISTASIDRQQMTWASSNLVASATGSLLTVLGGAGGVALTGAGGQFAHVGITDVPVLVAKALLTAGGGTYTYDGAVTLTLLPNTLAGSYKTTVTQTLV